VDADRASHTRFTPGRVSKSVMSKSKPTTKG
jgi:hypothetical protein